MRCCPYSKTMLMPIPICVGGVWKLVWNSWFVVIAPIFRKPSVLAFLPLGIMVCSTPLFQKSLSIPSRYTPGWSPAVGSQCPVTLFCTVFFHWCPSSDIGLVSSLPTTVMRMDCCDLFTTRNLEVGTAWSCLPLHPPPCLARSRHLINACGMSREREIVISALALARFQHFLDAMSTHFGWAGARLMESWRNRIWPAW